MAQKISSLFSLQSDLERGRGTGKVGGGESGPEVGGGWKRQADPHRTSRSLLLPAQVVSHRARALQISKAPQILSSVFFLIFLAAY